MAKQTIGIGTTANDGTGDTARDAFDKVNDNFTDLYDNYAAKGSANTFTDTQTISAGGLVLPKTTNVGIKVDASSPTWGWRDLLGYIHTRTSGGTIPSFVAYRGAIYQFSFGTAGGQVEVFNEYHMPHDYVPGTDMYIHTHWSTITAPTGNVNWLFDIIYAKGYSQSVFEGTASSGTVVTVSVAQASATAFKHEIAEVQMSATNGLIDFNDAATYSITSGQATLTSSASAFASSDIGTTVRVVGAGAAGGNLDTTITAYSSATSVTVGTNAGTTLTNSSNAAKRRVIDTALLEVDGLVLVRTWRDSTRTADTLDVAPFLHFVDIHYQSSGVMGTKQRNGPAFYT